MKSLNQVCLLSTQQQIKNVTLNVFLRYESTTSGVSSPQSVITNSDEMSYQEIQEIPSIPEIDQLLEANDFQGQTYATLDLSCFDFVRDGAAHARPIRDGVKPHDTSDSNDSSSEDELTNTESNAEDFDEDVEILCLSAKNLGIAK